MPPPLLIDLSRVDTGRVVLTREEIYQRIPHRFEFMLLDGVCLLDTDTKRLVAFADIRPDAWWVRGHIPGRPLLPGALMLEMAGQASAVGARLLVDSGGFMGFGGVEECKFRKAVVPPARLYLLCVAADLRPRRILSHTQGVVGGSLVFEAKITGLSMG